MGVIQNAINQMINTAAVASRLSPGYETRQELYKLGAQEKALTEQEGLLKLEPEEYEKGETVGAKQLKDIYAKKADIAQRQFELKPSVESLKKAQFAGSAGGKGPLIVTPAFENEQERRADEAMNGVAEKQNAAQAQEAKFKDYVKNLEIKGGGTVGDLPDWALAHIMTTLEKEKEDK